MTAAPRHPNFFLHALGALVLAAALALAWTSPVQAAGRAALAPKALKGGDPGNGNAGNQGNQNGNNSNNNDPGKGKGKGKGKDKGSGGSTGGGNTGGGNTGGGSTGGGDNADTGIAPSPINPPPSNPAPPPPPPSPPLPGGGTLDPSAPPPSPDPAPSPVPSSPDPTSPDPGSPNPGPNAPNPSPSNPDIAPSSPPPVVGSTNGNGSSGPTVVPPSSPPNNSEAPSAPSAPSVPTVAAIPSFRQAQPGSTGGVSPQNARGYGNNLQTSFSRVLFNFKRLLHLWGGNHAGLSLRQDGVAGAVAILVSLVGRAPLFAIYTPEGATTNKAGAKYRLSTWLRSAHPGATLCLRTQELDRHNQLVRTTESCVSASARWQHFRLSTKSLGARHKLRFSVYQLDAVPGDSFEVGGLTAGRVQH